MGGSYIDHKKDIPSFLKREGKSISKQAAEKHKDFEKDLVVVFVDEYTAGIFYDSIRQKQYLEQDTENGNWYKYYLVPREKLLLVSNVIEYPRRYGSRKGERMFPKNYRRFTKAKVPDFFSEMIQLEILSTASPTDYVDAEFLYRAYAACWGSKYRISVVEQGTFIEITCELFPNNPYHPESELFKEGCWQGLCFDIFKFDKFLRHGSFDKNGAWLKNKRPKL